MILGLATLCCIWAYFLLTELMALAMNPAGSNSGSIPLDATSGDMALLCPPSWSDRGGWCLPSTSLR